MTVSSIVQIDKRRYRIYIDDRVFCVLYKGELSRYGIEEGSDISAETCEKIRLEVLIKRARLRAMNLLMKHSFTEKKLREKLVEGYYPEDIVDDAIDYVVGYGYVNDTSYARDYVLSHAHDKSIRRIKNDLIIKGVSADIIDSVLNDIADSDDAVDEEAQIRKLLIKRGYDPKCDDMAAAAKTYKYLCGRGYCAETVRRVMKCSFE